MFDTPIKTSDQSIDRVLAAGLPVVLVFLNGTATAGMQQAMERLAKEEAGKLLVVQVQVKDSPESARRFQVSSSPAVLAIRDGNVQSRAEIASPADLQGHALYLLGRGPRPSPSTQASGASSSQPHVESRPGSMGQPLTVVDASFDRDVIRSPIPVLVDFWAPWCGPCRMTEPTVTKLAQEKQGTLRVAKVNVDENPRISQQYGVQSIPTMVIIKNGRVIDRWVGALPEPAIRSKVEAALK